MYEKKAANNLLTRKEATAYLGSICLTTLGHLKIPYVNIGRRVFYRLADLDKWLSAHTVKPEVEK
jgi:hypothetical protein